MGLYRQLAAGGVAYSNNVSGLSADNVQSAIDELVSGGGGSGTFQGVYDNSDKPATIILDASSGGMIILNDSGESVQELFQVRNGADNRSYFEVKNTSVGEFPCIGLLDFAPNGNENLNMGSTNTWTSGNYSIAIGKGNVIDGDFSLAMMGGNCLSDGCYSIGANASSNGSSVISFGDDCIVSGNNSIAIGYNSQINNYTNSLIFGIGSSITGGAGTTRAVAIGNIASVSANNSTSMGYNVSTSATNSISCGSIISNSGTNSVCMGTNITNSGNGNCVIGSDIITPCAHSCIINPTASSVSVPSTFNNSLVAIGNTFLLSSGNNLPFSGSSNTSGNSAITINKVTLAPNSSTNIIVEPLVNNEAVIIQYTLFYASLTLLGTYSAWQSGTYFASLDSGAGIFINHTAGDSADHGANTYITVAYTGALTNTVQLKLTSSALATNNFECSVQYTVSRYLLA